MAYSTQRAVSDGTLEYLDLAIGYQSRADVKVFFNDLPTAPGSWAWVGVTDKRIAFTSLVPNGVEVLVQRTTRLDRVINVFARGAKFNNTTMDLNFEQMLYLTQEAIEGAALSDIFNDVDFHGYRLRNIGLATDPGDAVSLSQYQADALGAFTYKEAAAASAAAALVSQGATAASAAAALVSENATAADAATVAGQVAGATASAAAALASANSAGTLAGAAAVSAAAAAESYDNFDDRYLGAKPTDPSLDNDGAALVTGALYFNSALGDMRVYRGAAWGSVSGSTGATGGVGNPAFYEADSVISKDWTIGEGSYTTGVTISIASPAVATLPSHGFIAEQSIHWRTTGALPTGVAVDTVYYVIVAGLTVDNFQFSLTRGGAAVVTTGSQSGVHAVSKIKNAFTPGPVYGASGVTVRGENGTTWSGT